MKTIKELIFAAETVAHMKGYEGEILPLTERVKEIQKEVNRLYNIIETGGIICNLISLNKLLK